MKSNVWLTLILEMECMKVFLNVLHYLPSYLYFLYDDYMIY